MTYYDYHQTTGEQIPLYHLKLNGNGKVCGGDDFNAMKNQWLLEPNEYGFLSVRLKCTKCNQVFIKAFDVEAFKEQFSDEQVKGFKVKK